MQDHWGVAGFRAIVGNDRGRVDANFGKGWGEDICTYNLHPRSR